jgi:hypothetical protein
VGHWWAGVHHGPGTGRGERVDVDTVLVDGDGDSLDARSDNRRNRRAATVPGAWGA